MNNFQPPVRLLGALFLSFAIACLTSFYAAAVSLSYGVLFFLGVKNKGIKLRQLLKANFFILFLWVFLPFSMDGIPLIQTGFFAISQRGVNLSLLLTIKTNAILLIFISFLSSLNMFELGVALADLKCPSKLAWIFLLMDRNVELFRKEWQRLVNASKLRGFSLHASYRAYNVLASMLGLLLIRAYDRGKTMHEAMLLAGFNGELPFGKGLKIGRKDWLFLIFSLFLIIPLYLINQFM